MPEATAAIIDRFYDAWNRHDAAAIRELFPEGARYADPFTSGDLVGDSVERLVAVGHDQERERAVRLDDVDRLESRNRACPLDQVGLDLDLRQRLVHLDTSDDRPHVTASTE